MRFQRSLTRHADYIPYGFSGKFENFRPKKPFPWMPECFKVSPHPDKQRQKSKSKPDTDVVSFFSKGAAGSLQPFHRDTTRRKSILRNAMEFEGVIWRGEPQDFIQVDPLKCSGCGDCLRVCLGGCFTLKEGKASVASLERCMECAACWYVCEREAILLSWPKGGSGFATEYG